MSVMPILLRTWGYRVLLGMFLLLLAACSAPSTASTTRSPNGTPTQVAATSTPTVAAKANSITEFPLPLSDGRPDGITAGPDGNLWFTEGEKIGRFVPGN